MENSRTLTIRRIPENGLVSLRYRCDICGQEYLLQLGPLHSLVLGHKLAEQLVAIDEIHVCKRPVENRPVNTLDVFDSV